MQHRLVAHRGLRLGGPQVPSWGMRSWGSFQAAEPLERPWEEGEGVREGEETSAEKGGSSSPKRLTREPRGRAGLRLGSRRGLRGLGAPPGSEPPSVSVMDGRVLSEEEPRLSERGCRQRRQQCRRRGNSRPSPGNSRPHYAAPTTPTTPAHLERGLPGRGGETGRRGRGPVGT